MEILAVPVWLTLTDWSVHEHKTNSETRDKIEYVVKLIMIIYGLCTTFVAEKEGFEPSMGLLP